jgi:nickel-dependent lactate racemase
MLDYAIACDVNRLLVEGEWHRIISIGQLVPHEVAGIANQNKNVFIGTGGADTINKTHFLGAVYGMERMMGRADTPVRRVLDHMERHFGGELPITYVLTVRSANESGELVTRGLFAGDDSACFTRGAELCRRVNVDLLDEPIEKAVVYLDPAEFKSTWLGNKAIYRTRMAMADRGELIVLAPGVREFGEDPEIDRLIRAHGYVGTERVLAMVKEHNSLNANLSAAAHLIHGSSEGRFTITYCPGGLTREEIESVGFRYAALDKIMKRYDPKTLQDGYNTLPDGERVFFVSNPGLGLWALRSQFE